jgi:hypothetical protein
MTIKTMPHLIKWQNRVKKFTHFHIAYNIKKMLFQFVSEICTAYF